MDDNVTIRPIRRKDAVALARMTNRLNGSKKLTTAFVEQHCFGRAKSARGWVAIVKGEPIGFAMTSDWANFNLNQIDCTLNFLFVEDPWRGQGIGRRLAAHAARDAVRRGCVWFRTSANPNNKDAQRLYRDLGFTQRSYRPFLFLMEGKALRHFAKP